MPYSPINISMDLFAIVLNIGILLYLAVLLNKILKKLSK